MKEPGEEYWPSVYQGVCKLNVDPEKRGRIKIQVVDVLGKDLLTEWAEPMMLASGGPDQGDIRVPDVETAVWIMFQHGDVNRPVYALALACSPGGVPEIPKLAKEEPDETVTDKGTDSFEDANGATQNEPGSPYAAEYPFNRVWKTKKGHVIEIDDTEGHERIQIWHRSGSFMEHHPDGKKVLKTIGKKYEIVIGDFLCHIHGTMNVKIDGDLIEYIAGNVHRKIAGNLTEEIGGNKALTVGGVETRGVVGSISVVTGTNYSLIATGTIGFSWNAGTYSSSMTGAGASISTGAYTVNATGQITENSSVGIANNSGNNTHT